MKFIPLYLAAALLTAPAFAQRPAPNTPDMQLKPAPEGVRVLRPSHVPCEADAKPVQNPVLRYCALAPDALWPPAPKPKPKSGIFPLDQT